MHHADSKMLLAAAAAQRQSVNVVGKNMLRELHLQETGALMTNPPAVHCAGAYKLQVPSHKHLNFAHPW